MSPRRAFTALITVAAAVVLAGCSPTVSMTPAAEFSNDPECAAATVRMPDALSSYALRQTDAQATAAWGEPTVVLSYCGVPVPEVSDLPCVEINGIFWLREDVPAGLAFTTYGRDPAFRVIIDVPEDVADAAVAPGVVLDELSVPVSYTSENGRTCVDVEDTVTGR
ncbi:DUF3515 family protein [Pseudolysinimonas sp.]|jgi:hypothetical protein|uniref:DUF3515 family protein n=1 Tax=Pseudolysinimonas sp. TaxID=2680009 RepID=UPI00378436EC